MHCLIAKIKHRKGCHYGKSKLGFGKEQQDHPVQEKREKAMPPTVVCGVAALAVATLFYGWRSYHERLIHKQRTLRERIAYMLWVVANGSSD